MRQPYRLLTLGLALCAVAALVGALVLLNRSHTADVDAEVGKWLLTASAALVLTGALSMVVKQIDQRRSERQAWHEILNDLVAANQKLVLARVRLQAHQSAKTYQEQLAEVMAARVEVRRIGALDIVNRDRRAISGPLTPVTSGLSRSLTDTPPRRSGHVTGPNGTDSQADSAGSIPVTRSKREHAASVRFPGAAPE
jgi:hypothetical protein